MIVADASVLANLLADDRDAGRRAREAFAGHDVSVPDLADVEVASVLRRRWLSKTRVSSPPMNVAPGDSAPEDPGACQREKEELDREYMFFQKLLDAARKLTKQHGEWRH